MPVMNPEDYLTGDMTAIEILQRQSINSLLGLQNKSENITNEVSTTTPDLCFDQRSTYIGNAQKNYCIPVGRVPLMEEFPSSPEGGQIPQFGSQYSCINSPERTRLNVCDKFSDYDNLTDLNTMRHPDSPDSRTSSHSTCSNVDGCITEKMNGLSLNVPQLSSDYINQRNNGYIHGNNGLNQDFNDSVCTWRGSLPCGLRSSSNNFSPKIFLGGLPWDVDEKTLIYTFKRFGPIKVDWPGKENNTPQPKGFVYIIFQTERQVRHLLYSSTYDASGNWYFTISTKKMRSKQVQIIPWDLRDSNYVKDMSVKLDPSRTVFVGALHGMLTAEGLAKIMNDLFGGVVFAGIDTDKYKYPIGSGRVTFDNFHSYERAVNAAFINIKTEKFYKKIQVNPYLEDSMCSVCNVQQGPYFCKTPSCFRYFCRSCWQWQHPRDCHKPLTRSKSSVPINGHHFNQKIKSQQFPILPVSMQSSPVSMNNNSLILCSHGGSDCVKYKLLNAFSNKAQDM